MSTTTDLPALDKAKNPDDTMMIDPFEVRMRFTTQLQHLSAAVTSSQKAAHYALKYRDLDEDLHSCILEQLERVKVRTSIVLIYSDLMYRRTT
jgi:CTD kinase subunit gamma